MGFFSRQIELKVSIQFHERKKTFSQKIYFLANVYIITHIAVFGSIDDLGNKLVAFCTSKFKMCFFSREFETFINF